MDLTPGRPAFGPEIVDLGCQNNTEPVQNPSNMVGREAPHNVGLVLNQIKAAQTSQIADVRFRNLSDLRSIQAYSNAYQTLYLWKPSKVFLRYASTLSAMPFWAAAGW
jgi:hypothetical protein